MNNNNKTKHTTFISSALREYLRSSDDDDDNNEALPPSTNPGFSSSVINQNAVPSSGSIAHFQQPTNAGPARRAQTARRGRNLFWTMLRNTSISPSRTHELTRARFRSLLESQRRITRSTTSAVADLQNLLADQINSDGRNGILRNYNPTDSPRIPLTGSLSSNRTRGSLRGIRGGLRGRVPRSTSRRHSEENNTRVERRRSAGTQTANCVRANLSNRNTGEYVATVNGRTNLSNVNEENVGCGDHLNTSNGNTEDNFIASGSARPNFSNRNTEGIVSGSDSAYRHLSNPNVQENVIASGSCCTNLRNRNTHENISNSVSTTLLNRNIQDYVEQLRRGTCNRSVEENAIAGGSGIRNSNHNTEANFVVTGSACQNLSNCNVQRNAIATGSVRINSPNANGEQNVSGCRDANSSHHNFTQCVVANNVGPIIMDMNHNVSAPLGEIIELDGEADDNIIEETRIKQEMVPRNDENVNHPPNGQASGQERQIQGSVANMEVDSFKELNLCLLRLLECPVCLDFIEPPTSQCRRGHIICSKCKARMPACPVCRSYFSSVRNRAMEGVAELVRYPCRHGCGIEMQLQHRSAHEADCAARTYSCPILTCEANTVMLLLTDLTKHFQSVHSNQLKNGPKNNFTISLNTQLHDNWFVLAFEEIFHVRIYVDLQTLALNVYVSYIGPTSNAKNYSYKVTIFGQNNAKITYTRMTHSDVECYYLNVNRKDCFYLNLDQSLNFIKKRSTAVGPGTIQSNVMDIIIEMSRCVTK